MSRKPLVRTDMGVYHVMTRVNHKFNFPLPMEECWQIFLMKIGRLRELFDAQIFALVLMSNHYHMLVRTPRKNIDEVMQNFNRETTRQISSNTGLINHIFGARYRWNIAYDTYAIAHVLKYIFRNPVRAKITSKVEDYRFSTANSLWQPEYFPSLNPAKDLFPLSSPDKESIFEWLNTPLPKEQEELLKKALRRKQFSFNAHHSNRKLIDELQKNPWQKVSRHLLD